MTGPDYPNLERVVPGPEYPEVRPRSGAVIVWVAGVLVVVIAVLAITAAASQREPEHSSPQSPAEPASGAGRAAQALAGAPPLMTPVVLGEEVPSPSGFAESRGATEQGGAPPTVDRYRGTATWYCLSGSSACTRGYSGSDLVAAIDADLGFGKGDAVTVRYRDRSVTVTVVDVCRCPGERLIDLTSGAFSRLAPLGHGVIPVTIELAGSASTLPPTEALP